MDAMNLRLGIDIGGTNICAGILNAEYSIIERHSISIKGAGSEKEVLDAIRRCAWEIFDNAEKAGVNPRDIVSVGIGCPGAVDEAGRVVKSAANLPFRDTFLGDVLKPELGAPVYLSNDANTAALGEAVLGAGRGSESFVMITLGTGVGGGIVIDGRIHSGFNGYAGEIGHIIIDMHGRMCRCGQRGCLEAYASANALIRDTKEAMEGDRASLMWELAGTPDNVDGKTAFDAKRRGDKTAIKVIEAYSRGLSCGITSIIRILQPEVISIGGGLGREGEYLIDPVRTMVYENLRPERTPMITRLCIAELGTDAGVIGAGMLERGTRL